MKFFPIADCKVLPLDNIIQRRYFLQLPQAFPNGMPMGKIIKITEFEAERDYEYAYNENIRRIHSATRNILKPKT